MKLRKFAALIVVLAFCIVMIPAVTAEKAETAESSEARIAELLDFASRLKKMEKAYAPKIDNKAEAMNDPYANARIIVKYAGELDYSGSCAHVSGYNDRHVIQYRTPEEAKAAVEKYAKLDGVEYAAPDQIMEIAQTPHNNTFLSWGFGANYVDAFNYNEWLLEQVDLSALPEIIVGVCDTGVDSDHEFLVGRLASGGYDFVNNDNNPEDEHYHGTHVSGTVIDGTLPNVKVMGIRVLDADGYGDTSDIVNGMEYANLHGCKVCNLSLRGPRSDSTYQMYSDVINQGADNGTVYCIASGNDGGSSEDWVPGSVARSFTVAAHDDYNSMAYFSNVGPSVDITAPGVDIRSAAKGGGYRNLDGTSMATPHVAAACAMLLSFSPELAPDDVVTTIKGAAVDVGLTGGGAGVLNVTDLLKYDNILNGEGSRIHFTSGGNYPWATDETSAFSTNSGVNSSVSTITSRVFLGAYQQISFEYKVSSEQDHDVLSFKANGQELMTASGETGWQTYTGVIPMSGTVQLAWEYSKNASGSAGQDKAWIRNVIVTKTLSSVANDDGSELLFASEGSYPWVIDGDAIKSGNAGVNNSSSEVSTTMHMAEGLSFAFQYKAECGTGDKFEFLVNGTTELTVSASAGWTSFEYLAPSTGDYTFTFRYVKNGSGSTGADAAWIRKAKTIASISYVLNVENGRLSFDNNGLYPWNVENSYAVSGNQNVASSSSSICLIVNMHTGDALTFRYKVSSEDNYDWYNFYANGQQMFHYSGNVNWSTYTYTAQQDGSYTFEWRYEKDYSVNNGSDCAYLDDVELITSEPSFIPGDCDGDGSVTVADALLAMRYAMGLIGADELDIDAANIDGSGTVDISDALTILRMAMGTV